jgi:hypothetical protein
MKLCLFVGRYIRVRSGPQLPHVVVMAVPAFRTAESLAPWPLECFLRKREYFGAIFIPAVADVDGELGGGRRQCLPWLADSMDLDRCVFDVGGNHARHCSDCHSLIATLHLPAQRVEAMPRVLA